MHKISQLVLVMILLLVVATSCMARSKISHAAALNEFVDELVEKRASGIYNYGCGIEGKCWTYCNAGGGAASGWCYTGKICKNYGVSRACVSETSCYNCASCTPGYPVCSGSYSLSGCCSANCNNGCCDTGCNINDNCSGPCNPY